MIKGDTVSLWVEKSQYPSLQMSSNNKVWDIEKRGERFLDLQQRDLAAENQAVKNRNISAGLLISAFIVLLYYHNKQKS